VTEAHRQVKKEMLGDWIRRPSLPFAGTWRRRHIESSDSELRYFDRGGGLTIVFARLSRACGQRSPLPNHRHRPVLLTEPDQDWATLRGERGELPSAPGAK
jgi:hypothetical protein